MSPLSPVFPALEPALSPVHLSRGHAVRGGRASELLNLALYLRRFFVTSNLRYIHKVINVDEIKN
jgi:hypothetical protein